METSARQRPRSIILLSGGLDSAVCLAIARKRTEVHLCLTMAYGQKAQDREIEAARQLSEWAGTRHLVIELSWLHHISRSSLTDHAKPLPQPAEESLDDLELAKESASSVWVPNRNGVFVHVAAAIAEASGCAQVVAGFNKEEIQTFPDNSAAFVSAVNRTFKLSTRSRVQLVSGTLRMSKAEIAAKALALRVPIDMLWSCYDGGDQPCGLCESCKRSERAFRVARAQ